MSTNLVPQVPRPLLWLLDHVPPLERTPSSAPVAVSSAQAVASPAVRTTWRDDMTHEQTNPLLAKWRLNANLALDDGDSLRHSIALLDDPALRDAALSDNPMVFKTAQATLALEKSLLQFDATWDKLTDHAPPARQILLSVHMLTPQHIIDLDASVLTHLLHTMHASEHRLLVAWEETEALTRDADEGILSSPVSPTVALALLMALQSEDAFSKVLLSSPAGVAEVLLNQMSGDAMLALDWLGDMVERLLYAGLRPDGPSWRDEVSNVDNATAIMTHWLVRTHLGETIPAALSAGERLPHNSMVAGASTAVFIAAAARFFTRAQDNGWDGNLQRTVHEAWIAYKQITNLSWLPPPLEQRVLATIAAATPDAYMQLREHVRSLRVPRLNAALYADWLGLVLAWLGIHAVAPSRGS